MSLLLQLNGDLPEVFPGHERRLYVFTCQRKACRRKQGCIRGFRATRQSAASKQKAAEKPEPPRPVPPSNLGQSLFGVSTTYGNTSGPINPFSTTKNPSTAPANPFATLPKPIEITETLSTTFADKAKIGTEDKPALAPEAHEPWPEESKFPKPFPLFHLDAEYETLSEPSTPNLTQAIPEIEAMDVDGGSKSSEPEFESAMDKTFQKFADRIAQNPEQVIRYEFKGTALLYSKTDSIGKLLAHTTYPQTSKYPRCSTCGSPRVFEVQLTPHAITALEEEETGTDGMDWGTIIFASCSKDCAGAAQTPGEVQYIEEWVGTQWEQLKS
jgi:pre-rRNA-processing protein TSR4